MHGGATPRGTASPHYKHGLYSRFASAELAVRINDLRQDEERLHDLREVLAVQGALLGEALHLGDLGAASALTEAVSRSIDRYHKHNPPEGRKAVEFDASKATDEELAVLCRAKEIITRLTVDNIPMQDTGSSNP